MGKPGVSVKRLLIILLQIAVMTNLPDVTYAQDVGIEHQDIITETYFSNTIYYKLMEAFFNGMGWQGKY